jgi:hypothetical protein
MASLRTSIADWEPGEPLFRATAHQLQPIISIKKSFNHDIQIEGARWSPEEGWRHA